MEHKSLNSSVHGKLVRFLVIIFHMCVLPTGGIIWEVEGRGSGSKGVAYHTDSPTQVED